MKISIAVFLLLVSFFARAQDTSVTCIPNSQLRTAVRIAEKYKILKLVDSIHLSQISLLQMDLHNRDTTVSFYVQKDVDNKIKIDIRDSMLVVSDQKFKVADAYGAKVTAAYQKQKALKFVVGGVSIVAVLTEFIFLIKK